jgi:hypothetical protein
MWCSRLAGVAGCLGLTVLLTVSHDGFAQGTPGPRMRLPAGGPVGDGHVGLGGPAGPPRLIGTPPNTVPPTDGHFGNRFPFAFYGWPYVYSDYVSSDYVYPEDSTADYSMEPESEPASGVYPALDSVPDVGRLHVSFGTVASKTVVRLTWPDHGVRAAQVAFFLADASRSVLSAQTVRSPPFIALFEPPPGTAFAGMTVVLPGGTLVTQFLPYRRRVH